MFEDFAPEKTDCMWLYASVTRRPKR